MTALRKLLVVASFALGLMMAPAASATSGPGLSGFVSGDPNLAGATSVAISGHYAYTTAYGAGVLTAVDFSNPAAPVVAGSSAFSTGLIAASTVNIAGGYAYVVSKNRNGPNGSGSNDDGSGNSLTILNISTNPAQPQIVGQITDTTKLFGAYGVAISGNYAYVAAQGCLSGQPCPNARVGDSFEVVDVSDPLHPKIVASLANSALPGTWAGTNALRHACSVTVSGHYAYVTAAYSGKVTIIDIANPLAPVIVSSLADPSIHFPVDVAVKGNYAYVADQASSLGRVEVVDVSNPASPHVAATVTDSATLDGAYRIRLRGNFAYVSGVYAATVTAIDISNPLVPRETGHLTDTTHLNRTTGLDVDSTGTYAVANSPYLSSQSNSIYPPYTPLTGTISVIRLDPTPIGVSITAKPANPTTQTAASFTFARTDAVSSVSCALDGAPLGFCTSVTTQVYSGLSPGAHTFTVQATDAAGNVASASYSWTIQQAPVNTVPPSISGTATQGSLLTASPGTWTGVPAPTFTYKWSDCDANGANCVPISGATSATYTVRPSDSGSTLEATVTGKNSVGSSSATTAPTAVVGSPPVNTAPPSISGTASQGQTLTASNGTWTGTPAPTFTYTWSDCDASGANCNTISGATSSSYTATGADAGSTLQVTVTGTNGVGSASASSAATAVVTAPPANTTLPAISGSASPGSQLTASNGTWTGTPAPTFTYQWSDCDTSGASCADIAGATSASYTAASSDLGFTLEVTVTGTNGLGSASATSAPTSVVASSATPPVNTALPSVPAAAVEGQALTASSGTWTGTPPPTYTYAWSDCNSSGASCNAITGATSATYTPVAADVGSTLEVTVTASNSAGTVPATSNATSVVSSAPGPVTPLLDDFNRSNANGPPGPSWSHTVIASSSATSDLAINGQRATGVVNANGADFWNPKTFGPDSEAWVTVAVRPTVDQDSISLGVRIQGPTAAATAGGYQAYYVYRSKPPDQYKIMLRPIGQAGGVILASANGPTLSPGDTLLFRAIGSTLELWRETGTTWTRILTTTDSTISNAGYLMLSARNTAVRVDNFGGGTLP